VRHRPGHPYAIQGQVSGPPTRRFAYPEATVIYRFRRIVVPSCSVRLSGTDLLLRFVCHWLRQRFESRTDDTNPGASKTSTANGSCSSNRQRSVSTLAECKPNPFALHGRSRWHTAGRWLVGARRPRKYISKACLFPEDIGERGSGIWWYFYSSSPRFLLTCYMCCYEPLNCRSVLAQFVSHYYLR